MERSSYPYKLVMFTLRYYVDIASGVAPIRQAAEAGFVKSAGRYNPMETFLVWRADIDESISSLAGDKDIWAKCVREMTLEELRFKTTKLIPAQRHLVLHHIFEDDCEGCSIVKRMQCYLNGEEYKPRTGPRRKI